MGIRIDFRFPFGISCADGFLGGGLVLKRLTIWGGVFIILIGLSQVFLPAIVSGGIAKAVKVFADAREVEVTAEKFPALLMLGGGFDKVSVQAKGVQAGKVSFDEFKVYLEGAQIDVLSLFKQNEFLLKNVKHADIEAVVSEAELASLINRKIKGAKNAEVLITPQKVTVKSTVSLGNILNASVGMEGKIIVSDNRIVFTTERFQIDNSNFGKYSGSVFTDLVLADFKQLPFEVRVRKVVMEDHRAIIQADNRG